MLFKAAKSAVVGAALPTGEHDSETLQNYVIYRTLTGRPNSTGEIRVAVPSWGMFSPLWTRCDIIGTWVVMRPVCLGIVRHVPALLSRPAALTLILPAQF